MRGFIDCQAAVVPWGAKAKFRRARVGLLRKDTLVYLAIFMNTGKNFRFLIKQNSIQILPAAIRFNDFQLDVFCRNQTSEQSYLIMLRSINVILKENDYRQRGRALTLDKFIEQIPLISSIPPQEFGPLRPKDVEDPLSNESLRVIKLCDYQTVPPTLWNRNRLQELTLTNCNLTCIPKELEAFSSSLTSLDLSSNKIDKLPRTFCCKMNNLKTFRLNDNQIETLPIEIKFFSKLINLSISNNRLRMIPSTFSDLRSLRHLNVANNKLCQLPAFRIDDIKLISLDVSNNPLDGASDRQTLSEIHPSIHDETLEYNVLPLNSTSKHRLPKLFEICMLSIVRCDKLLKLTSETPLPRTIVSTMQKDIFKCYKCRQMSILPAYNSTDTLDYVNQVVELHYSNYRRGMTFMKLLCNTCFDGMSS